MYIDVCDINTPVCGNWMKLDDIDGFPLRVSTFRSSADILAHQFFVPR